MSTVLAQPPLEEPPQALRRDAEVIALVGLAHGTSHFFHLLLLPPLFPWLMRDFGLSFTQAGFLMTVFFVISGVGQALAGFVVDRVGARPVLFFGIGMLAVSAVVLGLAHSYPMLILAAALAGLGNCVFHPADFTLLNRRVSAPRLGHAFSVHGLSGNLGWATAPIFMAGIAAASDWHTAAFAASAVGFAVLALLILRRRVLAEAVERVVVAPEQKRPAAEADPFAFLRSTAVWMCLLFFFFTTSAFGILQTYGAAILERLYELPVTFTTTVALPAYLFASAAGMIVGGFVAARAEQSERVVAMALAAAAMMATLLASGLAPALAVVPLMAVMGFGAGLAGPSRDLLVRKAATSRFGRASYGRVYGFVYSGLDVGLAAAPILFGPLLDRGRFAEALFGVALFQVLALTSALRVGRNVRLSPAAA